MKLDRYRTDSKKTTHPRLKHWETLLADEYSPAKVEVVREMDGFLRGKPRIFVTFSKMGTTSLLEETDWSTDIDQWLIDRGARAENEANESLRFGLFFTQLFRPISERYGAGYFNAVLLEILADDFAEDERIASIIQSSHHGRPYQGVELKDCQEAIRAQISRVLEMLDKLYAGTADSGEILVGALAAFLDERFHIAERKALGWG